MLALLQDTGSFTSTISWQDRKRLREVVRRVHLRHYPAHMLTNAECDKLIDAWGPQAAGEVLRKAVEARRV